MGSEEEETIEQATTTRRERIEALRAARQLLENPDVEENDVNVKFRNYLPHDKQFQEGKHEPPKLPKFEDPIASEPPVEEKKEPNWDLRRDVQKKLDKLEKRTQKAIFQLMEQQEKEKQLAEENDRDDDSRN